MGYHTFLTTLIRAHVKITKFWESLNAFPSLQVAFREMRNVTRDFSDSIFVNDYMTLNQSRILAIDMYGSFILLRRETFSNNI